MQGCFIFPWLFYWYIERMIKEFKIRVRPLENRRRGGHFVYCEHGIWSCAEIKNSFERLVEKFG